MKVYYIGSNYDGCYYVRCLLPQRENGWDGQLKSFLVAPDSPEVMMRKAMNSDVVVFHRPDQRNKVEAMKLLQLAGKKVVFDNDDTYKPNSGVQTTMYGNKRKILDTINENLQEAVKIADLVTSSTEFLAEEYKPLNPNVVTLKNCIDPEDWSEPKRNEGHKLRVGMVGSVTTADYDEIIPVLKFLSESPEHELVILGLPPKHDGTKYVREVMKQHIDFWESLNIEWHPLVSAADYKYAINDLRLDLALIPRNDNYFNRCKSNLKFMEHAMCEVPCATSTFKDSPYENDPVVKCETHDDWMRAVNLPKEELRKLGKTAKEFVLKEYNIQDKAQLWEEAYKKLIN